VGAAHTFNVGAINLTTSYNFSHSTGPPAFAQVGNSTATTDGTLNLWGANVTVAATTTNYPVLLIAGSIQSWL